MKTLMVIFALVAAGTLSANPTTMPQLPAGHPPIPQGTALPPIPPGGTPTAMGALLVQVVQGTKDAPPIVGGKVHIDLVHRGKVVEQLAFDLDNAGSMRLDDLPLNMRFEPVVRYSYNGVEFRAVAPAIEPGRPEVKVALPVFESTDQEPGWNVGMRHVMIQYMPGGAVVTDIMGFSNPTDRAWTGAKMLEGPRTTFRVAIPPTARDLKLEGGFQPSLVAVNPGALTYSGALVPGVSQWKLTYVVPLKDGKLDLPLDFSGPVKQVTVMLPNDNSKVESDALTAAGEVEMGGQKRRLYRAADVKAGSALRVTVSGVVVEAMAPMPRSAADDHDHSNCQHDQPAVAARTPAAPLPDVSQASGMLGGIGAGIVVLLGLALMVTRGAAR